MRTRRPDLSLVRTHPASSARWSMPDLAAISGRDLPRLIARWPHELADQSPEGSLLILSKLRRALRAERRRALAGHWSYELNRHLGLMTAYKAELGLMRRAKLRLRRTVPAAAQSTSAVEAPNEDAMLARRPGEPAR